MCYYRGYIFIDKSQIDLIGPLVCGLAVYENWLTDAIKSNLTPVVQV